MASNKGARAVALQFGRVVDPSERLQKLLLILRNHSADIVILMLVGAQ